MKKIIIIFSLSSVAFVQAQVAIGKANVTNSSVSLEFANTENRGLIVPYVTDKSGATENGTILYDTTDYKVKYLKDTNTWFDLSVDASGTADLTLQNGTQTEQSGAKVTISTVTGVNSTPGILVLSDTDRAMILPKVASPHLSIIQPSPGMIVYDTTKRQLAVYNGTVWSFWKP